jgi:glycosyltransferase 2 family protein
VLATIGFLMTDPADGVSRPVLIVVAVTLAILSVASLFGILLLRARMRRSGIIQRVVKAAGLVAARPMLLLACLALSLGVQTMFVLINMRLGSDVGVNVPLAGWFVAWPLAKLVALAPISLAGLGVREAALVAFMRPYGAPTALVTAAGLLWQSVLVAGGLIGWLAGSAPAARASIRKNPRAVEL